MLRGNLARLGGEASRLGDRRRVPRPSALHKGEGTRDQRHDQRRCDGGEQYTKATRATPRACQFTRLRVPACMEEIAFDRRQIRRQLQRCCESRAAVKVCVVAARFVPRARGRRQQTKGAELFAVLGQPSAQPRPLAYQRLVRDLGRVVADDQESGGREPLEKRSRGQVRKRNAPTRVLGRFAQLGQPEEHPPHQRLLLGTAGEKDRLRRLGDRPAHAAGSAVARRCEHAPVAAEPRLVERMRKQREGSGLALDVGQHGVDEAGLESKSRGAGRALDRPV